MRGILGVRLHVYSQYLEQFSSPLALDASHEYFTSQCPLIFSTFLASFASLSTGTSTVFVHLQYAQKRMAESSGTPPPHTPKISFFSLYISASP